MIVSLQKERKWVYIAKCVFEGASQPKIVLRKRNSILKDANNTVSGIRNQRLSIPLEISLWIHEFSVGCISIQVWCSLFCSSWIVHWREFQVSGTCNDVGSLHRCIFVIEYHKIHVRCRGIVKNYIPLDTLSWELSEVTGQDRHPAAQKI